MVSKNKKKPSQVVIGKDGVSWLIDDAGIKIKKIRKKIRRSSIGSGHGDPHLIDPNEKKGSTRTMKTADLDVSERLEPLKSKPERKQKMSKTKTKNIREIESQLWRIDDNGTPSGKVRKKAAKVGLVESLSRSDHGPMSRSDHGPMPASKRRKNKKALAKGSMSVRNLSAGSRSFSDEDSPQALPLRRLKSQPELAYGQVPPAKPNKSASGSGLDLLMSQSVHEHVRRKPTTVEKSKRSKASLGKIFKVGGIGKSIRNLSSGLKDEPKDITTKSLPEARTIKLLQKDVQEIDGVLWRVDEHGNKLIKVRRKPSSPTSSGDEAESSTSGYKDESIRRRKKERRNSATHDSFVGGSSGSFGNGGKQSQDSEKSLYTDEIPTPPNRSSSIERGCPSGRMLYSAPGNTLRQTSNQQHHSGNNNGENHNVVQNLQHRLKASEKEVARLCRVAIEHQDTVDKTAKEQKKVHTKLKTANRDKQALVNEVEKLRYELETKNERKDASGGDHLVAQICVLRQEKDSLISKMENEGAQARSRLEQKEDEVGFLQEELGRMRSKQGDRQLEYMQKLSTSSDDDSFSGGKSRNHGLEKGKSMHLVSKILGNHLQNKADTEAALQQQELNELQDRVCSLQLSNEQLKIELRKSTLEIKEDDDEDVRMAKEAALKAAKILALSKMASDASKGPSNFRMPRRMSGGW